MHSPEKERLLNLEKEGKWVFHGSALEIEEFEPRQAFNFIGGKNIPDGEPAVFASSVAEYAIFMAVVNEMNCPEGLHSSAGTVQKDAHVSMQYRMTQHTSAQLKGDASGWVYVFDRSAFTQRDPGGVEFVSPIRIAPADKIKVRRMDLPENIEIS